MTIHVKGMSEGQKDALDVAESARETEWKHPSFAAGLFVGAFRPDLILPYPEQADDDRRVGDEYLAKLEAFLKANLDPGKVDRTAEVPDAVLEGLAKLGAFGIKIPKAYGGLGMSQTNYNRAVSLVASYCGSTAVWLSAHQSIGVPQPLKLFGTEEQKKKYLPRLAAGEISAFALTEPDVGSDPARMSTTAVPAEDGSGWTLSGQKLWCTNGPAADVLIVMARTPSLTVDGREKKQITAFIVERSMPGVEVVHRCDFMGLRGIQNGLLRFRDVKVPKENVLWGVGQGLKLALITLNTGRLTLPAACVGGSRQCLRIVREWANVRTQWGVPIGRHDAVAQMIGTMAAETFAMDAMTMLAAALVDKGGFDIRLEAAMAKLFASEANWRHVDATLQIRGGRGYETAESLRARGEKGPAVERMMRDARINRIIEGTTQIMHLFIAREALDPHLKRGGPLLDPKVPLGAKAVTLLKAGAHYGWWYPVQWALRIGRTLGGPFLYREFGRKLSPHADWVAATSNRLAATLFHCLVVHGPKLERRQAVLARIVEIGTELYAMSAAIARARTLEFRNPADRTPLELADLFCRQARRRIRGHFRGIWCNDDVRTGRAAKGVLGGDYLWLERGIIVPDEGP